MVDLAVVDIAGLIINGVTAFCAFLSICITGEIPPAGKYFFGRIPMVFAFLIGGAAALLRLAVYVSDRGIVNLRSYKKYLQYAVCLGCLIAGILAFIAVIDWIVICADFGALPGKYGAVMAFDILSWLGFGLSFLIQGYCIYLQMSSQEAGTETKEETHVTVENPAADVSKA